MEEFPDLDPETLPLITEGEDVSVPPAEPNLDDVEYGERMQADKPPAPQGTTIVVPPERPPELHNEELEKTYDILEKKYKVPRSYCGVLTRLLAGMSFEKACVDAEVNPSGFMLECSTNPPLYDTFHMVLEMKGVRAMLEMDEIATRLQNLDYIPNGMKLAIRVKAKVAEIFAPRLLSRTARKKVGESHYKNAQAAYAARKQHIGEVLPDAEHEGDLDIPEGIEVFMGGKKLTRNQQ